MNDQNQLRQLAEDLLADEKATQHQKLNGVLRYVVHLDNRMDDVQEDVNANPLAWIPKKWRSRVAAGFSLWVVFITITSFEKIPVLIDWLKNLGVL